MHPQGSVLDVRVRVLGGFEVEGLTRHQLGSRKARTLLKLLALARARPVAIDHLIECLWPNDEAAPSRTDEQLAVVMSRVRAGLGPERLVRTDAWYTLICDWLDLAALEELDAATSRLTTAGA